jgi:hypothetical protein
LPIRLLYDIASANYLTDSLDLLIDQLINEEFHGLYASANITTVIKLRRMRGARPVPRMEEMRKAYKLVGKPEGNRLRGKPRRRLENNIKMDFREIGCGDVDEII